MQSGVAWAMAGQAVPHIPQLAALLWVSVQAPLQFSRPPGQDVRHMPPEQTSFAPHGLSHAPQ
jgi:hypothetical protein